jgi:iron complex outermembrane receptor protein
MFETGVNLTNLNNLNAADDPKVVFGSTAPAYWLVNLDARLNMNFVGLKETYFQLNVYNLFDKFYVGGFGGGLAQAFNTAATQYGNPPFVSIGAPRTVSGSLSISF